MTRFRQASTSSSLGFPPGLALLAGLVALGGLIGYSISGSNRLFPILLTSIPYAFLVLQAAPKRLFLHATAICIALVLLTPPWFNLSYATGHEGDNRLSAPRLALALQVLVLLILVGRLIFPRERAVFSSPLTKIDFAFLGWLVFSTMSITRSLDPYAPSNFVQKVVFAAFFYVFARLFPVTEQEFLSLLRIILLCAGVLAVTLTFESLAHIPFLPPGQTNKWNFYVYQSSGILAYPTTSAFVLLYVLPLSIAAWFIWRRRRVLLRINTAYLALCLFLTFSRSALIGAGLGGILLLAIGGRVRKLVSIALISVVTICLVLPWFANTDLLQYRLLYAHSAVDRVTLFQQCLRVLEEGNPFSIIFGMGYDNFRHIGMMDPDSWQDASDRFLRPRAYPTHNTHLTILVEMGLITFSLWALLHVLYIRVLYRAWKRSEEMTSTLAGSLLLSEMAFLIALNGHTMTQEYTVFALFWLLMGLVANPLGPFIRSGTFMTDAMSAAESTTTGVRDIGCRRCSS